MKGEVEGGRSDTKEKNSDQGCGEGLFVGILNKRGSWKGAGKAEVTIDLAAEESVCPRVGLCSNYSQFKREGQFHSPMRVVENRTLWVYGDNFQGTWGDHNEFPG